ncbi:hypothetical protein [Nocardia terpenica]|uniref:Uncharacterized protein n=1 Tax=Nocardia terpenica TaxID=455432 RepID=A0A164HCE0_9NOCA|nr:hypothetical protein [Nocardia terpenica]KZM68391.1 hypothetical protein AWN90_10920 [Nocardia terpenica]NQE88688.1 hypothetical protein [Nocardia terpenica]
MNPELLVYVGALLMFAGLIGLVPVLTDLGCPRTPARGPVVDWPGMLHHQAAELSQPPTQPLPVHGRAFTGPVAALQHRLHRSGDQLPPQPQREPQPPDIGHPHQR